MEDVRCACAWLVVPALVLLAACGGGEAPESEGTGGEEGGYTATLGRAYQGGFADRTRGDMQAIGAALGQRLTDAGDYPQLADVEALAGALEPVYIRSMPRTDAWGSPFQFQSNGTGFTLTSYGPDGAPGGDDDLVLTDAGFR